MLGALLSAGSSLLGGLLGKSAADKDRKLQKKAMTEGIQMRVADAQKAGVHPIYALGAPTFSPSPVGTGGIESAFANMGSALSDVTNKKQGHVGKSILAGMDALTLERAGLENELLRAQIRNANRAGLPPAVGPTSDLLLPLGNRKTVPMTPGPSSTAQRIQDEYGDLAENVYGSARAAVDISDNLLARTGIKQFLNYYFSRPAGRPGGYPRFGGRR